MKNTYQIKITWLQWQTILLIISVAISVLVNQPELEKVRTMFIAIALGLAVFVTTGILFTDMRKTRTIIRFLIVPFTLHLAILFMDGFREAVYASLESNAIDNGIEYSWLGLKEIEVIYGAITNMCKTGDCRQFNSALDLPFTAVCAFMISSLFSGAFMGRSKPQEEAEPHQ